jgi:hypothetical protein
MKKKDLEGKTAKIKASNDNENYDPFRAKELIITHASNNGNGYDSGMYPEMLCDFKCADGTEFPFALYEYEFDLID